MQSYRPTYHASVPSGWSNDPNGTIFYKGKAHLFYQHYPHKAEWGTMHWGHFATEDFVKWENLPVALVPDRDYEVICGCCSGSTIEKDGELWLIYTAAQPERQRQCLAVSTDGGIHFEKNPDNPILTSGMLSLEVTETDCRDPRLFKKGEYYYMIAGARVLTKEELEEAKKAAGETSGESFDDIGRKRSAEARRFISGSGSELEVRSPSAGPLCEGAAASVSGKAKGFISGSGSELEVRSPSAGPVSGEEEVEKDGYGNLILARSKDLLHWEYIGHLLDEETEGQIHLDKEFYCLNGVYECPDYIVLDGREVVLTSPQNLPQIGTSYQNVHSGVFLIGELSFENGRFRIDEIGELDNGFDFYAAQTLRMPDDRVIMIAWKEMWDRNFPTQKEGWAGTYSLPRELSFEDGQFVQKPVREIQNYRRNQVTADAFEVTDGSCSVEGVCGNTIELKVTLEPGSAAQAGVKLFCGSEHETLVYYDRNASQIIFDRSKSGLPFSGQEKDVDRRVCPIGKTDFNEEKTDFVEAKTGSVGEKTDSVEEKTDSIELHFFLDISSLEVFINGGRHVMTGNVYPDLEKDLGVQFFAKGGTCLFKDLVKYDILV